MLLSIDQLLLAQSICLPARKARSAPPTPDNTDRAVVGSLKFRPRSRTSFGEIADIVALIEAKDAEKSVMRGPAKKRSG
jgi:hypothetical protein